MSARKDRYPPRPPLAQPWSHHLTDLSCGETWTDVADARGVRYGWEDLGGAVTRSRKVLRSGRVQTAAEKANYLKGFHAAEADFQRRKAHVGTGPHHGARRRARQERRHMS